MGNGTEKLKELADYITLTNDEDGVAVFLEENLL
jgi:hydroxymethylpyrimidine pyrophosphatase-like HAD family hydrolase